MLIGDVNVGTDDIHICVTGDASKLVISTVKMNIILNMTKSRNNADTF